VVVRAPAVLRVGARAGLGAAIAAALALYLAFGSHLPRFSDWGDVAFLAFLGIPAMFALVWVALPLREDVPPIVLGGVAAGLALVAALLHAGDLDVAANFAKLAAAAVLGWWFLTFFEAAWWVALVAFLIVPVDLYSVARGPTREITEDRPQVFDALSVFFPVPGEDLSAQLGLTDILFFALFLGATARFGLRTAASWTAMTASFGATLAIAVGLDEIGVAALPLLSAAFVLVNADLILRSLRHRPPPQDDAAAGDDATRA
jgi:hypothetical protein